jgi:hypothetical protein
MKHMLAAAVTLVQLLFHLQSAAADTIIIGEYYDGHVAKGWVNVEKQTHGPQPVRTVYL